MGLRTVGRVTFAVKTALLTLLLLTASCAAPLPPNRAGLLRALQEDVTLQDLAAPSFIAETEQPPATRPIIDHHIVAQRLVFPRPSERLRLAMEMVEEPDIEPAVLDRWRANGLGIGVLRRDRLPLFLANLPNALDEETIRIIHPVSYRAITLIDRVEGARQVRLNDEDGRAQTLRLVGGQYQVLIKLLPPLDPTGGPLRLDLLPHHYNPLPSVIPRNPEDKTRDGLSFHELRLSHPASPREFWVIWPAHLPPLETEEPAPDGQTGRPIPQQPLSLAETMLSGQRRRRPVQIVLLIGVDRP